ncbi:unnamed protein product [Bursaphelenchus xylophilus]|uniref:(pine wood nematode) hypothetical protein n=1 Tax=Bursaphelenchus xylophilus TaxID=6326 RepID=A0A1I7RLS8_BURXY|nr:unnamed protein product [Bursaphelenchus xylophilus]CAG9106294.1 unnamed protein product [Bursaphelenchus xylophilus]
MVHYSTPWKDESYWTLMNDKSLTFDFTEYSDDDYDLPYFRDHRNEVWSRSLEESILKLTSDESTVNIMENGVEPANEEDEFSWIFKAFEEIKMSESPHSISAYAPYFTDLKSPKTPIRLSSTNSTFFPNHSGDQAAKDSLDSNRFFGSSTYICTAMIDPDVRRFYQCPKDKSLEQKIKMLWA